MPKGQVTRRAVTTADRVAWPNIDGSHGYTASEIERFLAKVDMRGPTECWLWTSAVVTVRSASPRGYGQLARSNDGVYTAVYAHRMSYELANEDTLGDSFGCHSCDNTICVSPYHVFRGTASENMRDAAAKDRLPLRFAITDDLAPLVRERIAAGQTIARVAADLGVGRVAVARLWHGLSHAEAGGPAGFGLVGRPRKFTASIREDIGRRRLEGIPLAELAAEYDTHVSVICRIAQSWRRENVTDAAA